MSISVVLSFCSKLYLFCLKALVFHFQDFQALEAVHFPASVLLFGFLVNSGRGIEMERGREAAEPCSSSSCG